MDSKSNLIDLFIHDLTGVLSIVTTSVNSLLKKRDIYGPITQKQQNKLNMILRNSSKAQNFLNEIIEIYKSEEGIYKKEFFPVADIFRDSIIEAIEIVDPDNAERFSYESGYRELCGNLKDYGVEVEIEGKYNTDMFCHDKKKVQQILRNLFTNALKHRRERIIVKMSGKDELCITVEDDGEGIPEEKQKGVFKRFSHEKEDAYPGNDTDGLGFGLSCVKKIVETMSGNISLTSCVGVGTNFTVHIPPLK
jgi:signal transduction histidine kinase